MFKFLKEKLGSVVKKFSKDVEEESEKIPAGEEIPSPEEEKREFKRETKERKEEEKASEEKKKETKEEKKEPAEKKRERKEEAEKPKDKISGEDKQEKKKDGLFSKIFKKKEKEEQFPDEEKKLDISITKKDLEETQKEIETSEFETIKESPEEEVIVRKETKEKKEDAQRQYKEKEEIPEEKELQEADNLQSEKPAVPEEKEKKEEKKGFFSKIADTFTKINLSEEKFESLFWDLEVMLMENNVAVEVIQKIKEDLKKELMSGKISRKNVDEIIRDSLKESLEEILDIKGFSIEDKIKNKKPYIIAVIGVNGSGKTTTIAKLCNLLQKNGHSVVLAAADTFRAAAIQQLEHHAEKLGVKIIKHDYNSDPAAVAFDAIKHAEAKKIDVVVIDTAGRLHSNDNLMNELKKLIKVNKPDLKLFVGESITGNDCVEQAKVYDEIIGIDAIILSKADIDEKGGAALSISYVTKKPVLFIGTGQTYDDLKAFDKKEIMEGLGF